MPTKRQTKFFNEVVEAARSIPLPKARGCPMPDNLTIAGRAKGLKAMQESPRCCSRRRDGQMCCNPSMKGATKCVKHGGRVQVPEHPHNIRRFLSGAMHRAKQQQENYLRDKEAWEALTVQERQSFSACLPGNVIDSPRKLYRSIKLLKDAEGSGYAAISRIWAGIRSGKLL